MHLSSRCPRRSRAQSPGGGCFICEGLPKLQSVILLQLQGTLRSLQLYSSGQEGLSSRRGLRLLRHQAMERTYFRKTGIHLPLSEKSGLIVKLFAVSFFSYLLNWLKLELMAGPALLGSSCVCPGDLHSHFGLIKGSANPLTHSDPQLEAPGLGMPGPWLAGLTAAGEADFASKSMPWAPTRTTHAAQLLREHLPWPCGASTPSQLAPAPTRGSSRPRTPSAYHPTVGFEALSMV